MDSQLKLQFLDFLEPKKDPFNARHEALRFLPECGLSCGLGYIEEYIEALGDKQMVSAIKKMRNLKKNLVTQQIENTLFSAYDRKGIKQRIRDGSAI